MKKKSFRSIFMLPQSCDLPNALQAYNSDAFCLDLEDGVSPTQKALNRQWISRYLARLENENNKPLMMRVNSLKDTLEWEKDYATAIHSDISILILPKIDSAKDMATYADKISVFEERNGLPHGHFLFLPVIETPLAVIHAAEIAFASPRNIGLIFGAHDLSATLGIVDNYNSLNYARQGVVIAAKAANIYAYDSPFLKIERPNACLKECLASLQLGFDGKIAIHPQQIPHINGILGCNLAAEKWAKTLDKAIQSDARVLNLQGKGKQFIGPPHQRLAEHLFLKQSQSDDCQGKTDNTLSIVAESVVSFTPFNLGDIVKSPFELTIGESWITTWNSVFFSINSLTDSQLAAKSLGLKDRIAPFSFLSVLCAAMSVIHFSAYAKYHLSFENMIYLYPVYLDDTLNSAFTVTGIQHSSDKQGTIVTTLHSLKNAAGETVFELSKKTLFHYLPQDEGMLPLMEKKASFLLNQVLQSTPTFPLQKSLQVGSLFIHRHVKQFHAAEIQHIATLFRLTNPNHYNLLSLDEIDLAVPGPFVVTAACSLALFDFGNYLYEEMHYSSNINMVNYGDTISALSYISSIEVHPQNDAWEQIHIHTLGIMNFNLDLLEGMDFPQALFSHNTLLPKEIEAICLAQLPFLCNKIACQIQRTIVRPIANGKI